MEKISYETFVKDSTVQQMLNLATMILPQCTEDGPWIAGGILHRTYKNISVDTDIDVFFKSKQQFESYVVEIFQLSRQGTFIIEKEELNQWHRTYILNFNNQCLKVQCIHFRFFESLDELFGSFDINVCMLAYDGKHIVSNNDVLESIRTNKLSFNKQSINYPSITLKRLVKYTKMGYDVDDNELKVLSYAFFYSEKKPDIVDPDKVKLTKKNIFSRFVNKIFGKKIYASKSSDYKNLKKAESI